MATLTVWKFQSPNDAAAMLQQLSKEGIVTILDAARLLGGGQEEAQDPSTSASSRASPS